MDRDHKDRRERVDEGEHIVDVHHQPLAVDESGPGCVDDDRVGTTLAEDGGNLGAPDRVPDVDGGGVV
jgi:hypothetical protein